MCIAQLFKVPTPEQAVMIHGGSHLWNNVAISGDIKIVRNSLVAFTSVKDRRFSCKSRYSDIHFSDPLLVSKVRLILLTHLYQHI